ncbi:ATPase [Candidatus Bathyarchaeota archaeon]|nr:ATPase [Candidatus Bathyarchaeota archaeon]
MEEHHVLGVDGGGSRTRCVIASLSGHILARGSGGPSNPLTAGFDCAAEAIQAAVEEASRRCGINSFEASVMGLAGTERASAMESLVARLTLHDLGNLKIIGDAQVALAGATGCRPGVVVISGTGSIAYGENDAGETARAGGWGWRLGDEGSGYDIGNRALIAALRDHDGRGPATLLTEKIRGVLGLGDLDELVDLTYRGNMGSEEVAALAGLAGEAAGEGDNVALRILEGAGVELGIAASAVIRRLGLTGGFKLGLVGGVFNLGPLIRMSLERSVRRTAPNCVISLPRFPPEVGAALLALRDMGVELEDELLHTMEVSFEVLMEASG